MAEVLADMQTNDEIISTVESDIGWITLNRPKALNSLSLNMIRTLKELLTSWQDNPNIKAVVVQGTGERAFCAGGDVRAAYDAKQRGRLDLMETFFREEYALNTLIHEYPKPYIAILDGIAMGGGLGVSINSRFAVVTERSSLAMPETAIGFFPDVGASWFLSNTPDSTGIYWALTGNRFNGADAIYGRLASCYISSGQIPELIESLKTTDDVEGTLNVFQSPVDGAPIQHEEKEIHEHFQHGTLQEIFGSLETSNTSFAERTLKTLKSRSPTSLLVTLEQFRGLKQETTFRERMQREFRMSQRFIEGHDFFEGVRAVLIDKDNNPKWNPGQIQDINVRDIQTYFSPLEKKELEL